ncbi:MAG TPA: hypothetical protein VEL73_09815, partial [Mycobacteriales bacterium]|nr:hypothetical protein [Mycobacteriales bacterium]
MDRISVFTATRAEYGLLSGLLSELAGRAELDVQLVVSGAHLAPEFGRTAALIEADGFVPAATV